MDDPESSITASVIFSIVVFAILLSVFFFCLETVPYFSNNPKMHMTFVAVEIVCTAIFTAEFAARISCCPHIGKFLIDPLNIIDVAAIFPFYVHLGMAERATSGDMALRELRILRVARLLKMARRYSGVKIFLAALSRSSQALGMLVFFLCFGVVFFASLVYFCERDDNPAGFSSIPASFWWGVVTMTTVGYGDVVPVTILGRMIASVTMVCGLLFLSLPMSVIGNSFTEVMREFNEAKAKKEAEDLRVAKATLSAAARAAQAASAAEDEGDMPLIDDKKGAAPPNPMAEFHTELVELRSDMSRLAAALVIIQAAVEAQEERARGGPQMHRGPLGLVDRPRGGGGTNAAGASTRDGVGVGSSMGRAAGMAAGPSKLALGGNGGSSSLGRSASRSVLMPAAAGPSSSGAAGPTESSSSPSCSGTHSSAMHFSPSFCGAPTPPEPELLLPAGSVAVDRAALRALLASNAQLVATIQGMLDVG